MHLLIQVYTIGRIQRRNIKYNIRSHNSDTRVADDVKRKQIEKGKETNQSPTIKTVQEMESQQRASGCHWANQARLYRMEVEWWKFSHDGVIT